MSKANSAAKSGSVRASHHRRTMCYSEAVECDAMERAEQVNTE